MTVLLVIRFVMKSVAYAPNILYVLFTCDSQLLPQQADL